MVVCTCAARTRDEKPSNGGCFFGVDELAPILEQLSFGCCKCSVFFALFWRNTYKLQFFCWCAANFVLGTVGGMMALARVQIMVQF